MKKHMKHSILKKAGICSLLVLCAMAQVLLFSGCALFPEEEEPISVPLIEVKQVEYLTRTPERMTIENRVEGRAEIVPLHSKQVAFENSSGTIAKLYVNYGDYVNEGDLLCALESPDIGEELIEAEMRAEISEMEYAQSEKRYKNGEISEIEWKKAELSIYIVRRDLAKLREQYENTQLYAPMSGQITYRADVAEGERIQAQDTLFTISSLDQLCVRYSGIDYGKLPLYAECDIILTRGTESETYKGTVIQTPDNLPDTALSTDRYSVLLELERDLPEGTEIGTQVTLSYLIERSENALVIAKSALKTSGTRTYVYVLEDGYRRERDVQTGISSAYNIEIISGLKDDDQIIY